MSDSESKIEPSEAIPDGAKIIIPAPKVTEKVKKERTEAQKQAFLRMRQAKDDADKKRKFTRAQALEEVDKLRVEEAKKEEDERLKKVEEMKQSLPANVEVIVQKKRGRKVGEKIPYGGKNKIVQEDTKETLIEQVNHNVPASVPKSIYAPKVVHTQPFLPNPVYENPYMAMLRNKRR